MTRVRNSLLPLFVISSFVAGIWLITPEIFRKSDNYYFLGSTFTKSSITLFLLAVVIIYKYLSTVKAEKQVLLIRCLLAGGIAFIFMPSHYRFLPALLSLLFLIITFIPVSFKAKHATAGIESLLLLILVFFYFELTLGSLPAHLLNRDIVNTPPLASPDRTIKYYQETGFRGERPCEACNPDLRIVTTGGSSTYGVPLYYNSGSYPSQLSDLLHRRHPKHTFEVLNAGVAGHGLTQIAFALEHTIKDLKPDIVTVNCWFNDSSPGTGWYGLPGYTDKEAFEYLYPLWKLQSFAPYQALHRTKTFALFRLALINLKKKVLKIMPDNFPIIRSNKRKRAASSRRRLPPGQYQEVLTRIVQSLKADGIIPVLMFEPLHRTSSNRPGGLADKYFSAVASVSEKYGVPFINPLPEFAKRNNENVFHDFIHPSSEGHALIAEALYDGLFSGAIEEDFLKKKGIQAEYPASDLLINKIVPYKNQKYLHATLIAPFAENNSVEVELSLEGQVLKKEIIKPPLKRHSITLKIPDDFKLPLLSVGVRSLPPKNLHFPVGTTGVSSPVHIKVQSGGKPFGWYGAVKVNNRRVNIDKRGYNVVVIDSESGSVIDRASFDTLGDPQQGEKLISYLRRLIKSADTTPPLVAITIRTDGHTGVDAQSLGNILKRLGGTGTTPRSLESFALIGVPHAPPGSALEESGPRFITLEAGDAETVAKSLITVEKILFTDSVDFTS